MIQKIIIAPDSFKGSLSAQQAADAIARGARNVFGEAVDLLKLPVADGGEGTMETLRAALNGRRISLRVHDPLMRPLDAGYALLPNGTAVIEMATAAGLPLLSPAERNPMYTTTYGVGELIADALQRGVRNFLLCIGGSATNDAGIGMLQALGYRFTDIAGQTVAYGGAALARIAVIDDTGRHPGLDDATFTVACDVNNPFSGPAGAAYVYAPQKGATSEMVAQLDAGLQQLAGLLRRLLHVDLNTIPGAGAAGGMGGGLHVFLSARLLPGIEMVLNTLRFDEQLDNVTLVITGEGKMDTQTAMGKAPAGVLRRAQQRQVPVIAFAGLLKDIEVLQKLGFQGLYGINPEDVSPEQAMQPEYAAARLESRVEAVLRSLL